MFHNNGNGLTSERAEAMRPVGQARPRASGGGGEVGSPAGGAVRGEERERQKGGDQEPRRAGDGVFRGDTDRKGGRERARADQQREAAYATARQYGDYATPEERRRAYERDIADGSCGLTGIEPDCCPCGRHE